MELPTSGPAGLTWLARWLCRAGAWSVSVLSLFILGGTPMHAREGAPPDGWTTAAPRAEIRPEFSYDPEGGPHRRGAFIVRTDEREGLQGWWTKTFPVRGGAAYRFSVLRRAEGCASPRRAAVARLVWSDDRSEPVTRDEPSTATYQPGRPPRAEPEYPADG